MRIYYTVQLCEQGNPGDECAYWVESFAPTPEEAADFALKYSRDRGYGHLQTCVRVFEGERSGFDAKPVLEYVT